MLTQLLHRMFPGLQARADMPAGLVPPSRESGPLSLSEATAMGPVYRALQIIGTSVGQLSLKVYRGDALLTGSEVPAIIRRPNLDTDTGEFLEGIAMCLAATGNAYLLMHRAGDGSVIELDILNPHHVYPHRDKNGKIRYGYDGRTLTPRDVRHIRLMTVPGSLCGVGPLQAAQDTMRTARDMRAYMGTWWDHGAPSGVLTSTDTKITPQEASQYRDAWNNLDSDGNPIPQTRNPSRIRVLGRGLKYEHTLISPKEATWVEAQTFTTLDFARIFGVPASLMLVNPEGNSMTYANVEQEWLGFARFGLMAYLRKIESALTDLVPRGQRVKFNLDALLRADTRTRYEAHRTGLEAGFLTLNEVRSLEDLPPLDDPRANEPAPWSQPSTPSTQQESLT